MIAESAILTQAYSTRSDWRRWEVPSGIRDTGGASAGPSFNVASAIRFRSLIGGQNQAENAPFHAVAAVA